jgi:SAM-dependent methyltransferase
MLDKYFKQLYQRTMRKAYSTAHTEIIRVMQNGGKCLDCGANNGHKFDLLKNEMGLEKWQYHGIEWNADLVKLAVEKDLNIILGDLNKKITYPNDYFECIFGLSVVEHLLNPCKYLTESYRCLKKDGTLVILTPNISTYFTIALLLFGKMPSSGPHPDSDALLKQEELFKVSHESLQHDTETDTPVHRHLVVFSYRVLKSYLIMTGFSEVKGYGFGLYPFPIFMQNTLERIDPYHCHQMVFIAKK